MTVRELKDQLTLLTDEGFANFEIVSPKKVKYDNKTDEIERTIDYEIIGSVVCKEDKKVWLQIDFEED